jgi:hypothetical protein
MSTENVNFKISAGGDGKNRPPSDLRPLTVEKVLAFIDSKNFDGQIKAILKEMALNYPKNALKNWIKNFSKHAMKAQKLLAKNPQKGVQEIQEKSEQSMMRMPEQNDFD